MNVKLVSITKSLIDEKELTAEELLVYIARVSNPSNQLNMETADKLIGYMVRNKHWSPFEMVDVTFDIVTSRAIAQQILRHRSFSFQEFCISADSKVKILLGKKSKEIKISDLYERYNSSYWDRNGKVPHAKVYDETLKEFVPKKILEIFKTGEKDVYELILGSGKSIKATADHKFLTKNGFKKLSDIEIGDFIATNGVLTYRDKEWLSTTKQESLSRNGLMYISEKAGVSYHTIRKWLKVYGLSFTKKEVSLYTKAWNKGLDSSLQPMYGKINTLETRSKMRDSSRKGSESNLYTGSDISWRKKVSNECIKHKAFLAVRQGIDFKDLALYEVDHILPVYSHPELAFDIDNLQLLKSDEHKKKSNNEYSQSKQTVKYSNVKSIVYAGKEMTYDLEVDHESHNYVANGIVTHNSQRYSTATEFEEVQLREAGATNRQSSLEPCNPIIEVDLLGERYFTDAEKLVKKAIDVSESAYKALLAAGVAKECARMILPLTTQTRVFMKGSLRSWIHYLQVRMDGHTQMEHREIAFAISEIIKDKFPNVSKALEL